MKRKIKSIILFFGLFGMLLAAKIVLAADFGVEEVGAGLEGTLTSVNPVTIVVRIIQIVLSFLGIIAVSIIVYAGFLWMTSGGSEEKVSKAKNILRNAAIGLTIVIFSWGIATFVLTRLSDATGSLGQGISPGGSSSGFISPGVGTIGACSVENVYPEDGQKDVPRNTSIMITFKESLDLGSVCVNDEGAGCVCDGGSCSKINPEAIRFYKTDLGDACSDMSCPDFNTNITDVLVSATNNNQLLILTPADILGLATGNVSYSIKFTDSVKKINGSSMFSGCSSESVAWSFVVGNKLDLIPPIVAPGGVFPLPDNERDLYQVVTEAVPAAGKITVESVPQVYSSAALESIISTPVGLSAEVILDYHGPIADFKVAVPADSSDKAQLFNDVGELLGVADFDSSGQVVFENYFTFKAVSHPAGSLWQIKIIPEKLADTLTVNGEVFIFSAGAENNNIKVPAPFSPEAQALNIAAKLSRPDLPVKVSRSGRVVNLEAKVAGSGGNNISVVSNNNVSLPVAPLTGGTDREESSEINHKKDRPMNSAIQLNFNEAINPAMVSGSASEVDDYIRVVNADLSSQLSGENCEANIQCRSYKCDGGKCVGDYLGGKFMIGNNYRTVEFISDVKCGVNGCGEEIYCLPASSHLAIELIPANLKTCEKSDDCSAFSPYTICSTTEFGYKTCQDETGKNYPVANLKNLDGIVDAAVNSFDGNRDTYSDGPLDFYDDNYESEINLNKKDKYRWSFYVSDQINLTPPQVVAVSPSQGQDGLSLIEPIKITFNTLMMNSSLKTGGILMESGTSSIMHKLINLRSSNESPLGYWISADNQDIEPKDGEPDITVVNISHSPFAESVTYKAQIGSGVRDIYQNCYKPSSGPGCVATDENPSCCFGNPTNMLSPDGNCQ